MDQQQLISILQASFDAGILIDESGSIQYLNTAARDFLSVDESAAAGDAASKNVEDVLVFYEHISDEKDSSKKKNVAISWQELKDKADTTFLAVCKTSSFLESALKSAEARLSHVGNYTLLFCSLQKELMGKIEKERNIIKGILDASLDPLFQINQEGTIQRVNKAAIKEFQWTEQEFLGSNISMICGGKHSKNHDSYMKRYLDTGETRVIGTKRLLKAKRKDGSEFMIQLSKKCRCRVWLVVSYRLLMM
jgi:PAS domain S-box-containing protein